MSNSTAVAVEFADLVAAKLDFDEVPLPSQDTMYETNF